MATCDDDILRQAMGDDNTVSTDTNTDPNPDTDTHVDIDTDSDSDTDTLIDNYTDNQPYYLYQYLF